jgi:hypothetical protein
LDFIPDKFGSGMIDYFKELIRSKPTSRFAPKTPADRAREILSDKETLGAVLDSLGLEQVDSDHVGIDPSKISASILDNLGILFKAKDSAATDFLEFWKTSGYVQPGGQEAAIEQGRNLRYSELRFMYKNSPEISLLIETIAEESISYKMSTGELVELDILADDGDTDEKLSDFVNNEIEKFNIDQETVIKGMSLLGDHFVEVVGISNEKQIKALKYETDAKNYKRINLQGSQVPRKFTYKNKLDMYPWEVLHYKIPTGDEEYVPYGRSIADNCRAPYRRLLILESLLALSRASKVDKLVVRVPTGTNNPEAAMMKLSRSRAMWHDVIFGAGKEINGINKPDAFTEVLWVPDGTGDQKIGIERLPSGIDFATTEDVEYFLDKVIAATGIHRAYFKPDEKQQGFRKLALQDLRFARKVSRVLKSYASGQITLGGLVLALNGKWKEGLHIVGKYRQISPIADDQITVMGNMINNVNGIINFITQFTGRKKITDAAMKVIMTRYLDLSPDVIDLILKSQPEPEEGEEQPVESRVKDFFDKAMHLMLEKVDVVSSKYVPEFNPTVKLLLENKDKPVAILSEARSRL